MVKQGCCARFTPTGVPEAEAKIFVTVRAGVGVKWLPDDARR